jgi:putative sterol carrier protein
MNDQSALRSAAALAFRRGFGATLRIEPDDDAPFDIDGKRETCVVVAPLAAAPDCTWRASGETLMRIFEGGRALESAYLSGRLHIAGDMSVMARLEMESKR